MHRSTRLCLLLLSLTLPGLAPAAVITLADNLSNTTTYPSTISNNTWAAQAFSTTASAFRITDIAVYLSRDAGVTGNLNVSIFDQSGQDGRPGSKVADVVTVDASQLGTVASLYDIPNLNLTLSASTSYFLLLGGTSLTGDTKFQYTFTGGTQTFSTDGGVTWAKPYGGEPMQMRILAETGTVPEPATLTLFAIGLAGLRARRAARRPR